MNAELPPFKNRDHNSESASTLDSDITPLKKTVRGLSNLASVFAQAMVYTLGGCGSL